MTDSANPAAFACAMFEYTVSNMLIAKVGARMAQAKYDPSVATPPLPIAIDVRQQPDVDTTSPRA